MPKLEDVIARNLLRLRTERSWTQSDVAIRMRGAGMANWQTNRVTQIETLRRPVSLLEVLLLSWVFEEPLGSFFRGEGRVELPSGETASLPGIQAIVAGEVPNIREIPHARPGISADELRRMSAYLALPVDAADWLARQMYGRTFTEERDARVGDTAGMAKRSVQTKRGNVTRTMMGELSGFIRAQGGAERVWKTYRHIGQPGPPEGED